MISWLVNILRVLLVQTPMTQKSRLRIMLDQLKKEEENGK